MMFLHFPVRVLRVGLIQALGAMTTSTVIEALVARYLAEHPGYRLPSGDTHPAFLALSSPVKHWIADQLGIGRYWRHMLHSAMTWFPTRETDARAFRYFCSAFEAEGNIAGAGHPEYDPVAAEYAQWRAALAPNNSFKPKPLRGSA